MKSLIFKKQQLIKLKTTSKIFGNKAIIILFRLKHKRFIKTRVPNPSPNKQRKSSASKESHFLPQTSINMIQTPKASISNFFKVPLLSTKTPVLSNRSNSQKNKYTALPSRSLQNSSKKSKSEITLSKGSKNIFDNSMYATGSNNKMSRRNKSINQKDQTPSMGHTQRSFWAKQEVQEPLDFIEKAKGFKGSSGWWR